ncbi:MAG: hypothetical protein ABGW77_06615 [Campylobacterales bacterium]
MAERQELLLSGFGVENPDIVLLKELFPEKSGLPCKKVREREGKGEKSPLSSDWDLSLLDEGRQLEKGLEEMEKQ